MFRALSRLALLLSACTASAQPTWITVQDANFRVYSTASERATRRVVAQLEHVRSFFIQLSGAAPAQPVPVSVMIFGTDKEYRDFRPNGFAAAYYAGAADRDFIVISETGPDSVRITTHEYTHLVLNHAGYRLPPWLSEGMAELYSTLRTFDDVTEFGDVMPSRLQEMQREPWVPMATILAADHSSPYYNERDMVGCLYNQGWALVHMLATTPHYRPKFWAMVRAVNDGAPSAQALEKAYGMPLAEMEGLLRDYVSDGPYYKVQTKIQLDAAENPPARPADMFEVRETQALLLTDFKSQRTAARERIEALSREEPKRPEPWVDLGFLAWGDGEEAKATEHFTRAYELGSRSPRFLLAFARLVRNEKPDMAAAALKSLLEEDPRNLEARLELAELQLRREQFADALATAAPVSTVRTTEQRDSLLYLRAYASLKTGDVAKARSLAQELRATTNSKDRQAQAEDVLRSAGRE